MREQTIAWLTAWGLGGAEYDVFLDIVLNAVTWRLNNLTGCEEVPEGLVSLGAAMAAGEYLQARKAKGELEGFDLETAIKSLQEGDTTVTFAIGEGSATPEQRLDALIDHLLNGRMDEVYRYRRLVW